MMMVTPGILWIFLRNRSEWSVDTMNTSVDRSSQFVHFHNVPITNNLPNEVKKVQEVMKVKIHATKIFVQDFIFLLLLF